MTQPSPPPGNLTLPCGCAYTPGIDLPITECPTHADDPALAHPGSAIHRACGRTWDEHAFGVFCS